MRQNAFRNALLPLFGAFATALLLASCGGGGGASSGSNASLQGGVLEVGPAGTAYAGVPYTLTITGGKAPYTLTSNEPTIFPLPSQTNSNFITVIPANPGVIDTGLTPGSLLFRTVNITVHDASTQSANSSVKVAQNFLTGYGISLSQTTCPAASSTSTSSVGTACAGGETLVTLQATTNGALHGNAAFRLSVIRGNFTLRTLDNSQSGAAVTTVSDHAGVASAILQVPVNATTQVAIIRVQDVATGVYTDESFLINGLTGSSGNGGTLTAVPNDMTFTGPLKGVCGTGSTDVLVFDGQAPYTAVSSDPANLRVTPNTSASNPGTFTVSAVNPSVCLSKAVITFTDVTGRRTTATFTTAEGSADPTPPPAFDVQPTTITLGCGQSGTAAVVGGRGSYAANSTHSRIVSVVSGNTVGITRLSGDLGVAYPTTGTVTVTDGAAVKTITVTVPATCP